MQERRRVPRTHVQKDAKLLLGNASVIACVVLDLTNFGAGVEIPDPIDLPDTLDLTFNEGRTLRPCRRIWQNVNRIGVQFR
jgi:PilZ domain